MMEDENIEFDIGDHENIEFDIGDHESVMQLPGSDDAECGVDVGKVVSSVAPSVPSTMKKRNRMVILGLAAACVFVAIGMGVGYDKRKKQSDVASSNVMVQNNEIVDGASHSSTMSKSAKVSKAGKSKKETLLLNCSKHSSKFGMLELQSWVNKSKSSEAKNRRNDNMSQQQQQQTNQTPSQPKSNVQNKQIVGGEYTTKEQRIRNEWIAKNDALGGKYDTETGTPDEDSHSTAPYHYIPPKLEPAIVPATPQSTNTSDWDFNMIANRARSWRSRSTSEGQIEWTPQDSSYGAAVPAFGCIPKRIRKLLEGVFVVIILALLIFIVVKVGIMLKSSSSSGEQDISFDDDDHYEAFSESNDNHSESNDNGSNDESNDHDADRI